MKRRRKASVEGIRLTNVHSANRCQGRTCIVHNQTDHHMRGWPLLWRGDRAIFERLCPHGIGHPDPDQFQFWKETNRMYESVHGCDGCCQEGNHGVRYG
jgi:hypothetical protein